eukprot:54773_1
MTQKATIMSNDLDDYFSVNNIQLNVDFSIINYSDYNDVDSVDESFIMVTATTDEEDDETCNEESETCNESLQSALSIHSDGASLASSTSTTKQLEFSLSAIRSKMEQKSLLKQLKEYNQRYNQRYNKTYKRYYKCYKFVSVISLMITFCIYCYWSYFYLYNVNQMDMQYQYDYNQNDYDYEPEQVDVSYYNQPHGHGFVHDYNYNAYNEYNTNDLILYLWQMVILIVMFIICATLYQVLGFTEPTAK